MEEPTPSSSTLNSSSHPKGKKYTPDHHHHTKATHPTDPTKHTNGLPTDQESADHTVLDYHVHDGCLHVLPQEVTVKDVKKALNWYYDFHDHSLQAGFHQFMSKDRSEFTALLLLLFLGYLLPLSIVLLNHDLHNFDTNQSVYTVRVLLTVVSFLSAVAGCGIGISLYIIRCAGVCPFAYRMNDYIHTNIPQLFATMKSNVQNLYQHFLFQIQLSLITFFLRRTFGLNCLDEQPWMNQISDGYCYDDQSKDSMLIFNSFLMICFPMLFFIIVAEAPIKVVWINLSFSTFIYLISALVFANYRSLMPVAIWLIIAFFLIADTQIRHATIYFTNQKLRETLLENERISQENRAQEMRSMIANVAHDLKTPLSSFTTGVDFIQHFVDELKIKVCESGLTTDYIRESTEAVQSCVNNIRNTNSFMLMTINRCIDYTKASKGLKLVPRYETLELLETLQLPLSCMQNIQNRIVISLKEIPNEICSHIITDKQWLQENVLCLLSNAVKYSSEGLITITVKLVPHMSRTVSEQSASEEKKKESGMSNSSSHDEYEQKHTVTTKTVVLTSEALSNTPRKGSPNSTLRVCPARENSQGSDVEIKMTSKQLEPPVLSPQNSIRKSLRMLAILQKEGSGANMRKTPANKYDNCHLRFEIEDTGIGMSEEAMKSLFNPFKQTQRLAGGTGLGLYSLAKRIEALNGDYGVRKRRDGKQGSLFWFSIPYKPDEISAEINRYAVDSRLPSPQVMRNFRFPSEKDSASPASPGSNGRPAFDSKENSTDSALSANSPLMVTKQTSLLLNATNAAAAVAASKPGKSLRVLIVDDSPAIVKMTTMMLKKLGFSMYNAENGQIAVKMVEEEWVQRKSFFDVILMDLQMPVMDGLEATRRIRKLEHGFINDSPLEHNESKDPDSSLKATPKPFFPHQVIIGLSANADHETTEQAMEAGVDTFMSKPFNMVTFFDTLYKLDIMSDSNVPPNDGTLPEHS